MCANGLHSLNKARNATHGPLAALIRHGVIGPDRQAASHELAAALWTVRGRGPVAATGGGCRRCCRR